MKRSLYLYVSVLTILIVGSCGLMEKDVADMDPKDLPDVRAFQDDFTREFMASTEPVEEGYYEFESKTGGYTMKFPENAIMDKIYFQRNKQATEHTQFAEDRPSTNIPYYVRTAYTHSRTKQDLESLLYLLSSSINYDGDFETIKHKSNTIYFARSHYTTKDEESTWYDFFGLITSNKSNQSLEYTYSVKCEDSDGDCSYDMNEIETKVKNIMGSVNFNDVKIKKGEN